MKPIYMTKHSHHRKHRSYNKYLRHTGRRQKRGNTKDNRGVITQRVSIEHRPEVVAQHKRIGDIEIDLMIGSNHKSALLVMTDRTRLVTILEKLEGK